MTAAFPPGAAPGTPAASERRLLLVHAHPDDESITTGATMARYAAEGAHVTLVTCTLGEEGEVVPDGLAHLAPDQDDTLGPHRIGELAAAMRALGVTDHRFLGGPGRYRDSGMMGAATNDRPGCFWQAGLDEAARLLAAVLREVRPQVLVTYGPDGGYGHPDHIKAHRVAMRAVELAGREAGRTGGAPHQVQRVYWNVVPRPVLEEGFASLHAADADGEIFPFPGFQGRTGFAQPDDVPGVVESAAEVDVTVDAGAYTEAKAAAMAAHETQVSVRRTSRGAFFALSNGLAQPLTGTEFFQRAHRGDAAPAGADDLFAEVRA
ncbi:MULTISPECIES: N-acetyl-1-D-myo-inositol-2-amino-2-deoxy-alpha-D-glucopyranoside deacetylase [Streptomyces]|uniref:1D-myo-inositol 2-acetamido-2-deoxy-alpha-D-glucopyranoside deacetylase n=1 Tax=Streptomyces qinglanensis TaxID=943816 RepID=A0A1E7K9H5_9ACTN|nr:MULTISPECIES: N-acetyl-1-D-myo-inositol-2-amino-2-deoxy-alpha-D-glucopyranoside deacetylase [Streptomyces]OEV00487.1 1D-myo-inositol 2-acetamido-2-deoxy-alpha-D-glucopyranoside deacetylase [Streptomyces qinglanensis]OEV24018.1 1D-myo-inositol 2-acetamido-2-deoxy-alpha-D-glucopyranoside deacetylase [Streptomyces nanshensis]